MDRILWKYSCPQGEAFELVRHVVKESKAIHLHDHDFAEIFWVESGQGYQILEQERILIEAQDLFLIHPFIRHTFQAKPGNTCTFVNLAFPAETMRFIKERYFQEDQAFWNPAAQSPPCYKLTSIQLLRMTEWIQETTRAPRERYIVERFLLNLFYDLHFHPRIQGGNEMPDWLRHACQKILEPEHFAGGTAAFVRLAGRCPEHVSRMTHRMLGRTPTDIVNQARLNYASQCLSLTSRKIADICNECGFDSLTHFYKLFREIYGITPHRHRSRAFRMAGGNVKPPGTTPE